MSQPSIPVNPLHLIPLPQEFTLTDDRLILAERIRLDLGSDAAADRQAAEYFLTWLQETHGIAGTFGGDVTAATVRVTRDDSLAQEGYQLTIAADGIGITGADAAGVYYAFQTLQQCVQTCGKTVYAAGVTIHDWPALKYRAAHYDTKHHQGTLAYTKDFIRSLAQYKLNVLVWEWEDKLAYEKHPEIGAPGAFTISEMQELSAFAQTHHIQIVPLIQGLAHVSYMLKHPEHHHLREVSDSNWQFCPLKEGTYELLADQFAEAIRATPGSEFIHIGSDETYEIGEGIECGCKAKADKIGKAGLMQLFIQRCAKICEDMGRTVLSWGGEWRGESNNPPLKSVIFTDSSDRDYLNKAKEAGYQAWVYAVNPGIVPLVLPLFPWTERTPWPENGRGAGNPRDGAFGDTAWPLAGAARDGSVEGSITTSWDDSGLHNQCWMPRFVCAGDFSWNATDRDLDAWAETFFANYFGTGRTGLRAVFTMLFEGAQFYNHTFQRTVWHWYNLGKVHLPDLPRGDLEYNNYWRVRYKAMLAQANVERQNMTAALNLLQQNIAAGAKNAYDLEIYITCAKLMRHNAELILTLANVEAKIAEASDQYHFTDNAKALAALRQAADLLAEHLTERETVYNDLVAVWERTRLAPGMMLPEKPYLFQRDRARHFANRTADMRYLVRDEDLLDIEQYMKDLSALADEYEREHVR